MRVLIVHMYCGCMIALIIYMLEGYRGCCHSELMLKSHLAIKGQLYLYKTKATYCIVYLESASIMFITSILGNPLTYDFADKANSIYFYI